MSEPDQPLNTPEAAEAAFYGAIARADLQGVMRVWAQGQEVVCIHPNAPRLVGLAAIRTSFQQIFQQGGVDIRPVQLRVSQNESAAVHNLIEEVHRTVSLPHDLHILATNVYIKTAEGWRMVTHHASVVPGEAPADVPVTALLH